MMRDRALKSIREERRMLLVGSPMCTTFSTWQRISHVTRDPVTGKAENRHAAMHLEFCVEL